jgi:hypothetical protein
MKLLGKKTKIYYYGCSHCNQLTKFKSKESYLRTAYLLPFAFFVSICSYFSLKSVVIILYK